MLDTASRPRHAPRILAQRADESWVLLDPTDGAYYALEGVSARVWELCDGERDVAAIVAAVGAEYDATVEEVDGDVRGFLGELVAADLLTAS